MYMCNITHLYVCWRIHACDSSKWLGPRAKMLWWCDMTHSYVWRDSSMCKIWLIHTCDMPDSCVWHDSFTCLTSCHASFMFVTCFFDMCDMIHSNELSAADEIHHAVNDFLICFHVNYLHICVKWLSHLRVKKYWWYVWLGSLMCVVGLIVVRNRTHC